MEQWYYHEPGQGRVGPLSAEELRGRYRERRIGLDTLVWREGLREWQPLERLFDELELHGVTQDPSRPPPLPPSPAVALGTTMPASNGAYRASPAQATPARSGLSGCAIAAIVLGVGGLVMLAILAAIAVPAYQDYVVRAKIHQIIVQVEPLKAAIAQHLEREGACPQNDDGGFGTPESYAGTTVASIRIGTLENERCAFELQLRGVDPRVDGETVRFEAIPADDGLAWDCSGGSLPAKYLPRHCRLNDQ